MTTPLLQVDDLRVRFESHDRTVNAVNGVSFNVFPGETVGIVGESGSGKTVTVLSLLGLVPSPPARIDSGRALFEGRDLLALDADALRSLRGKDVAVVFQDPMTSLNPVIKVGEQLREALWTHARDTDDDVHRARAIELLALVGVPQPERRYHQYPHEFSGGMRQRAMIAMAIANRPKLLIADEPTTALDVTIQAQVLDVLMAAKAETGAATVLITHDLGLVAQVADRVAVMYAGRVVEEGASSSILNDPRHPYTRGLWQSLPRSRGGAPGKAKLAAMAGMVPHLAALPPGCAFSPRCPVRFEPCDLAVPTLQAVAGSGDRSHQSACYREPAVLQAQRLGGSAEIRAVL